MDDRKILIINLSKGRVGDANANLLGAMLITKIYLAAMSRADLKEGDLINASQFYLYVDEFQSFANESFADILSEARKYKLNLTIANQYVEQMTEEVRAAVFGNVGTMITFRIGAYDAAVFEKEYAPEFTAEDLVNLQQYQMYLKLMIDGVTSRPFSATGIPPIARPEISYANEIIDLSREQFATPREKVEEDIRNWHVQKIGAKEPVKKSAEKDTNISERSNRSDRSSESNRGERNSAPRDNFERRSGGRSGSGSEGRPDNGRRSDDRREGRSMEDRPRIDGGASSGSRSNRSPASARHDDTPIKAPVVISTPTAQTPVVEPDLSKVHQKSEPKHVSLNSLNDKVVENNVKNNQKEIKPENAAALRNALLSVMGESQTENKMADPKVIEKPKEKDSANNSPSISKKDTLTPDDLKRILDIDQ